MVYFGHWIIHLVLIDYQDRCWLQNLFYDVVWCHRFTMPQLGLARQRLEASTGDDSEEVPISPCGFTVFNWQKKQITGKWWNMDGKTDEWHGWYGRIHTSFYGPIDRWDVNRCIQSIQSLCFIWCCECFVMIVGITRPRGFLRPPRQAYGAFTTRLCVASSITCDSKITRFRQMISGPSPARATHIKKDRQMNVMSHFCDITVARFVGKQELTPLQRRAA